MGKIMALLNVETAVADRYSSAAGEREAALCCPVTYDRKYLAAIPSDIIERDYGCGDPSAHLREGETVLDLGSGTGKICFIASQVVGPSGRVIGIDMNREMLALARSCSPKVAAAIGYDNVRFYEGKIQDLRFDPAQLTAYLADHPVSDSQDALSLDAFVARQKADSPLIADHSVDVVVSNCVLNLVGGRDKPQLFAEIYRVTKNGGRVVISDIVSDQDIPEHMQQDAELWSGCISGALREDEFVQAFVRAGFHGVRILARDQRPWQTVEGIEFRSLTVEAFKGKAGACIESNREVIYKGPFSEVADDDGHRIGRGVRTAVCDKTFQLLMREPYQGMFESVQPLVEVALGGRAVGESQGEECRPTTEKNSGSCC